LGGEETHAANLTHFLKTGKILTVGLVVSRGGPMWVTHPGWPAHSRIDAQRSASILTAQRSTAHHRKPSSLSITGSSSMGAGGLSPASV
jgi:hypothetical protein